MKERIIKILLIEDDPADVLLISEFLSEDSISKIEFQITSSDTITEGIYLLSVKDFDLILLDMNLPDGKGLENLLRVHKRASELPVIVVTGLKDEKLAVKAMRAGAQDYLLKGQIDSNILVRSIRYAIERKFLLIELESLRQKKQDEREIASMENLSAPSSTSITAKSFSQGSLREELPETFKEFIGKYEKLLDLSLEERVYKIEHNLSKKLASLGEELGFLKAGPRDLIEIHTFVMKKKSIEKGGPVKKQAYIEEGRLMILQLMGYLASFYRKFYY